MLLFDNINLNLIKLLKMVMFVFYRMKCRNRCIRIHKGICRIEYLEFVFNSFPYILLFAFYNKNKGSREVFEVAGFFGSAGKFHV